MEVPLESPARRPALCGRCGEGELFPHKNIHKNTISLALLRFRSLFTDYVHFPETLEYKNINNFLTARMVV